MEELLSVEFSLYDRLRQPFLSFTISPADLGHSAAPEGSCNWGVVSSQNPISLC